ncbi:MAG: hypothetical protein HUU14_12450 [Dehalococcoidia bacterium]|nr:hypothetical protein [Dehalococcoidia bacterium]
MTSREDVARAMAFFESCEDISLLHELIGEVAPRARRLIANLLSGGNEDAIPPPASIRSARAAASRDEAIRTLRQVDDFALLQVLARCIGQRIEAIEIAASADFPEGVRVTVPGPAGRVSGAVEATGTVLRVRLDNGETWEGPPSSARLETAP